MYQVLLTRYVKKLQDFIYLPVKRSAVEREKLKTYWKSELLKEINKLIIYSSQRFY